MKRRQPSTIELRNTEKLRVADAQKRVTAARADSETQPRGAPAAQFAQQAKPCFALGQDEHVVRDFVADNELPVIRARQRVPEGGSERSQAEPVVVAQDEGCEIGVVIGHCGIR